jgi:tripartite-type tricarboxylate transporter receptor subunit TctC
MARFTIQPTPGLLASMLTTICLVLPAADLAGAATALAADYPTRIIRLVVGFPAGGPTDIPARFVADKLGDRLGQRVLVENKPAAAGMLATREVVAQPKDGHTLLLCTHFESINAAFYKNPGFKLGEIAPVSLIAEYYYGVALSHSIPAPDFASFVRYAKTHPGEVTYGVIGAGSAQEILARQLEKLAAITMNRIPYRGGPQVVQEMVARRLDLYVAPLLSVMPQYQTGEIKLLAVSAPMRLASAPQLPTLRESGLDFVRFGWLGICAAEGTPQPIIDRLNAEIAPIVALPEYRALMENSGEIARSSTPAELAQTIKQTFDDANATIVEFKLQQE